MNMLTGKTKEDFEKWSENVYDNCGNGQIGRRIFYIESMDDYRFINTEHYIYNIGESMLNALIIEWFDSVDIYIEIKNKFGQGKQRQRFSFVVKKYNSGYMFDTRLEATAEAIKIANNFYNKL